MDLIVFLKAFSALIFVLSLIWLITYALRRIGPEKINFILGKGQPALKNRLKVIESLALDPKHKLILIRRDNAEHLLLLGTDGDVVVETNIKQTAAKKKS